MVPGGGVKTLRLPPGQNPEYASDSIYFFFVQ